MILVDIYIPSIDEVFDFELDEQARVQQLTKEIIEMISQKTKSKFLGDSEEFILYNMTKKYPLRNEVSLLAGGVANGDRLMLI